MTPANEQLTDEIIPLSWNTAIFVGNTGKVDLIYNTVCIQHSINKRKT